MRKYVTIVIVRHRIQAGSVYVFGRVPVLIGVFLESTGIYSRVPHR
jgi:hypothetical protein